MDVLGIGYLDVPDAHREAVVKAHPRGDYFKEQIIPRFPRWILPQAGDHFRNRER
jgi:hypothetical protein